MMNKIYSVNEFLLELKTFTDTWYTRIEQSLKTKCDMFISESGPMGEYLGSLLTGYLGTASAGLGFDLSNGINSIESKLSVLCRGKVCKVCNNNVIFFDKTCRCGSTSFIYRKDSRWGIDANSSIIYENQLDKYILQTIRAKYDSYDCKDFIYEAFFVDASNHEFKEYVRNQFENSTKSNNCNLLPYSYDFYRFSPKRAVEIEIKIKKNDSDLSCIYYNPTGYDDDAPLTMDLSTTTREMLANILNEYNINYKKSISKGNMIELIERHIDVSSIPMSVFPLKHKNLNKNRGKLIRRL